MSSAPPTEGTIQFAYALEPPAPETPPNDGADLTSLLAWRDILFRLSLLGQDPERYDGFGYGNVSIRSENGFVISASQTSGEASVGPDRFVAVTHWNVERFWAEAIGAAPPSSESLTHAIIYDAEPRANCVLHVHSPAIWERASKLPSTAADVPYGSPAMAAAVNTLLKENVSRPLLFTTRGHEDGVFAFGATVRDCALLLLAEYARSIEHTINEASP